MTEPLKKYKVLACTPVGTFATKPQEFTPKQHEDLVDLLYSDKLNVLQLRIDATQIAVLRPEVLQNTVFLIQEV